MNSLFSLLTGSELLIVFFVVLIFLLPILLFLLTIQRTLKAIAPESRDMSPGTVWLMLIPFLNIIWQFIMVDGVAKSLRNECARLQIPTRESKPTFGAGLAWCICNILSIIPLFGPLAALVTFIVYWIKIAEYKRLIVVNKDHFLLDAEIKAMPEGI